MTEQEKQDLVTQMLQKKERMGITSNAKLAAILGVSSATISNLVNKKWKGITDVWRTVENWVGRGSWKVVKTTNIKKITKICSHAQEMSITKAISWAAGSGKSCGAKEYEINHANVFYLEAEPHYTKRVFLQRLCAVMGLPKTGSIAERIDTITSALNSLERPLLIIDEFDQLPDNVLMLFKTIYNKATTGIVLIGGTNFERRIAKGVRNTKQSFCEIHSRLGGKFLHLYKPDANEIADVCRANGVDDNKAITKIVANAKGDLRTVKSSVEMYYYCQEHNIAFQL